jgi:uncharacterized protein YkwD
MARRAARFLALALSLGALWSLPAAAGANNDQRQASMRSLEQGLLGKLNGLRHAHGLVPLRVSSSLAAAARQHSAEMAARGYFSHSSANGSSFDSRLGRFYAAAGRRYWSVGENLLWSSPDVDPAGALSMWLNSPEHRRNMLSARWREVGLSAVHAASAPGSFAGREVTVVTADFGVRR